VVSVRSLGVGCVDAASSVDDVGGVGKLDGHPLRPFLGARASC